jgi:uncharacterized LabA/DUF88 family protein
VNLVNKDDRLRIAVFIDFDNIEIGVKNTMNTSFDAGLVLEALKERGDVVSKTAYSDWQRAGGYSRALTQHAIKMVQRNLTPGGDKNGADINLALDALEMAFTHPHINAFVIVGGDSDFISLVEKLKQYDKKVFVVGGRQFTSNIMQRNCHEFIAYENLVGASPGRRQQGRDGKTDRAPIDLAIPLVTRAIKVLSEREGTPPLGLLKTTLLQLDSTFSERTYGAGSFRDFAQKLERAGVLKLHQARGGWFVGPPEGVQSVSESTMSDGSAAESEETDTQPSPAPAPAPAPAARAQSPRSDGNRHDDRPAPAVLGSAADGVRALRELLGAAPIRRWPMYLRNMKQILRQATPSIDERAYGFASLVDLLRAAQREGIVRLERDRQGVIRIFQGTAPASAPAEVEVDGNRFDYAETATESSGTGESPVVEIAEFADAIAPETTESSINEPSGDEAPEAPAAAAAPRRRRRRAPAGAAKTRRAAR